MMVFEKMQGEDGEVEQFTFDGFEEPAYVRKDPLGRVYIDKCATDKEHFAKVNPETQERNNCRVYVEELFQKLVDRKGRLLVSWDFQEEP